MKKIYNETEIIIMTLEKYKSDLDWSGRKIRKPENIVQVEMIDDKHLAFEYLSIGEKVDILTKMNDVLQSDKLALKLQKQEKLLGLYKDLSTYVDEDTNAHKLPEITRLKILIKEIEND